MFWKNAKQYLRDHTTVRARLTLLYSVTVFFILTILTLLLYWGIVQLLHKADYQFLTDEIDTIHYILENKSYNLPALKEAIVDAPAEDNDSIYRYYIRLMDNKNKVIVESNGMPISKKTTKLSAQENKKRYWWYTQNQTHYLLVQSPIYLGPEHQYGHIQIALDTTYQHAIINDRKKLIFALLASALCSLLFGYLIANRSVRSLYKLTKAVKRITAASLYQRIDTKSWPKELRSLGEAFNQMLNRVETSFTSLKQFSGDLAHELRTPICNMIGEAEIALSQQPSMESYQTTLASHLEELHRTAQLIENMLFLARAENPQLDIKKTVVNAHEEIALVCDFFQAVADEKNITLTASGEASFPANSIMLRRAFNNILSNALHHTNDGGRIHFECSLPNQHMVQINLNDNGNGIAAEHLPHLFNRFYRVDSSRSQTIGGSGLGLAIVKSIVHLHQGTITITSQPEQGSCVTLTFPR
jgi:two-component system heavy metal sensor histidine kinase CusS